MFVVRCDLCGTLTNEPEPGDEETPGWLRVEFILALPHEDGRKSLQFNAHACPACIPHVQRTFSNLKWDTAED